MRNIKTEHNGAKNGGGMWDKRAIAKYKSRKRRRAISKMLARRGAR
jgi:hypothetical protein